MWAAAVANCAPAAILDFSASINPLGPPISAIAAIQANLSHLTAYPDPAYTELRQAIAAYHGIDADWVLPGNGAAELLTWACRQLAACPAVVLPVPAFSDYQRALQAFGATILPRSLQVQDWDNLTAATTRLDLSSWGATTPAESGVLLTNPHNPTGYGWTREAVRSLLDNFALVVVDEAFMDFVPPDRQSSVIADVWHHPNLVVVRSLTKFYSLPGLRLGYAIAHPDRLQQWQQWRDPWSVNSLAAAVGTVVLQDTAFQQQTWDWLAQTRPSLQQQLASLPGLHPYPSTANFFLVRTEFAVPPLQIALLKQDHVLIRDCLSFAELGDRYFRIAIRTAAENQRLLAALADCLDQYGN